MLGDLDADDLFEDEDDFADWQAFYVEAAERGDIILIGQCGGLRLRPKNNSFSNLPLIQKSLALAIIIII